jgi:hypothetical protein
MSTQRFAPEFKEEAVRRVLSGDTLSVRLPPVLVCRLTAWAWVGGRARQDRTASW